MFGLFEEFGLSSPQFFDSEFIATLKSIALFHCLVEPAVFDWQSTENWQKKYIDLYTKKMYYIDRYGFLSLQWLNDKNRASQESDCLLIWNASVLEPALFDGLSSCTVCSSVKPNTFG